MVAFIQLFQRSACGHQMSDLTPCSRAHDQCMRVFAHGQARMQIMGRTGSDETLVEAEQSRKSQRRRSIERLSRSEPAEPEDKPRLTSIRSGDNSPQSPAAKDAANDAANPSLSPPSGKGTGIQQCGGTEYCRVMIRAWLRPA